MLIWETYKMKTLPEFVFDYTLLELTKLYDLTFNNQR